GDPFKDTSGPSINTLLVVMSLTSSVFMGLMLVVGADGLIGGLLAESAVGDIAIWIILLVLLGVVLAGIFIWAIMKVVKHPKVMKKLLKKKE
ncbi:MAG: sodium/proton-translocating pyrophosphatase, partial [Candidatus Heimdallarchaeota archaeon]|nr:sodium/proton-translocating pyrophosphatase [Candidatus Heimdallarchaeota archaeon]